MDISDLIASITTLTNELARFEREYNIGSEAFYELYSQGKLDDGGSKQTAAFCEWAGLYQLRVKRDLQLREASQRILANLKSRAKGEGIILRPQTRPTALPAGAV
ncbi:MAG: hypothetical protein U9R15_10560 [Chloroflexota bacterium]|nr:hypothetical protein [Chloroflexota bacterium]